MKVPLGRLITLTLLGLGLITACEQKNPNDYPVSHWLEDSDPCVRASAAAIIKSGLPFPNFGTEEVLNPKTGKMEQHIKTVDMWIGGTRFVIPAEVAYENGAYPKTDPRRYQGLRGSLPHFYPAGPAAPVIDGMGSMVDVNFQCSMDEKYVSSWGGGFKSNEDGIEKVKQSYELKLKKDPRYPGTVTISNREDIRMTEVLLDRKSEANGLRFWEASYWPNTIEMKGPDNSVSGIGCDKRNDPEKKRYGNQGWRCTSAMRITPNAQAIIQVYVSHIQDMPAVYDQVNKLLSDAKK